MWIRHEGLLKPTVETRSPSPELREEAGLSTCPARLSHFRIPRLNSTDRLGYEAPQVFPSPRSPSLWGLFSFTRSRYTRLLDGPAISFPPVAGSGV